MSLAYELLTYVLLVIAALVPITNPFSTAPTFISMTTSLSQQERRRTATLACLYMCLMLIVFLLAGVVILQFFGISLQALRVGGGLIIAFMGFRMLFPADQAPEVSDTTKLDPHTIAFVPLALPMLSGPGSISVVISMATEVAKLEDLFERAVAYGVVGLGIAISSLICWLVLYSAGAVVRFLGESGINALTRIMGFLLVCIGCQFVLSSFQG